MRTGDPTTINPKCDASTCVPDFVIDGPKTLVRPPMFKNPKDLPAGDDPKKLEQTFQCDPALYQIVPSATTTSNPHPRDGHSGQAHLIPLALAERPC